MKNKITDKFFELIDNPVDQFYQVKIKQGPYTGVKVQYGKIGLEVNDDGETAKLNFEYEIKESPENLLPKDLEADEDFVNSIGDVLTYIIQTAFDTGKYKIGGDDSKKTNVSTTTNDDSPETGER